MFRKIIGLSTRDLKAPLLAAALFAAPLGGLLAQAPAPPSAQTPAGPPAASTAPAINPDEVVLSVGEVKLTAKDFEGLISTLPPDVANALPSLGKRGFAERYANLLSLAKEGEKLRVDQSDIYRQMISFQRLMLMAQLTVQQLVATMGEVKPEEINSYYTTHQAEFAQVKVRGIYVPFGAQPQPGSEKDKASKPAKDKPELTEAQAKAKAETLRGRITAGEDMAALAKKESDHPTAPQGGDFGFVRRSQLAPQLEAAIFALEPSQVSSPVRDRFGYFIFRVEEKRSQPLEEVKGKIENDLRQEKLGGALAKVQAEYPATLNPRYFNEPEPVHPAMPNAPTK